MAIENDRNPLAKLVLPRRWENLQLRASEANVDPGMFVELVGPAAVRIEQLLQQVRGGSGVFEVMYGLSGAGKTTFLRTLPRFFEAIRVIPFPKEHALAHLPAFLASNYVEGEASARTILIEGRDNPNAADLAVLDEMLSELLNTFRTPQGAALVLWPITRRDTAKNIADKAWETGRDSVVDPATRGIFHFEGIAKEKYYTIANNTSRNLTGEPLEVFGIREEGTIPMLAKCETISDFFAQVDATATEERRRTWATLQARVHARVWVVLAGDVPDALNATAAALTQGVRNQIDIGRMAHFVDREDRKSTYLADWRARRGSLAHLLRTIDLRIFPLPPTVSLAAIRRFGEAPLTNLLTQASVALEQAKTAMKSSRLYKGILAEAGDPVSAFVNVRNADVEGQVEYQKVQTTAAQNDKPLNKALAQLIEACLKDDAPHLQVVSEKRDLPGCELQPDIQIRLGPVDYICLEVTWRSTGEVSGGTNTLTEGYIQKYALEKGTQYVKGLDL